MRGRSEEWGGVVCGEEWCVGSGWVVVGCGGGAGGVEGMVFVWVR